MDILKVLLILAIVVVLLFPMMPFSAGTNKISTIHALKYNEPHNKKNLWFVLLAVLECVLIICLTEITSKLVDLILSLDFINNLLNKVPHVVNYITYVVFAIVINVIVLYSYSILKCLFKKIILDNAYGLNNKKKETPIEEESSSEELEKQQDLSEEERRIVVKDENNKTEEKTSTKNKGIIYKKFWGLFFEGPNLEYAKKWVVRVEKILQYFIYITEIAYALFFVFLLVSVFFTAPEWCYEFINNIFQVKEWNLYPFISLIILQEIVNVLRASVKKETPEKASAVEIEEQEKVEIEDRVRDLHIELQRRFDAEHNLRYFPEAGKDADIEYVCDNRSYASSLDYIQKKMKEKTGRIVQSYMECLNAAYNNKHVYFCAHFYSEISEYLIHYTYTRLLAGSRMMFVLADREKMASLRKFIEDSLAKLTSVTDKCTWRVYTSDERLDQADILIATPEDFKDDNIVENYPTFFEEVCNVVFIDADRIVELESYLCPVMAIRLLKATSNRVRFIFLSQFVLQGFATASLPRFFCVDEVLSFSSAKESDSVEFTLWNKESKRNVVYNKHGQTLTGLETLIAEQAILYGVDGVKIITSAPLDRADRDILIKNNIEINNFYKPNSKIHYMIYSDDKCNLAAALYASTRFRGSKKSVVHIISHPYLLREYFTDRMLSEEYINRSAFIQPKVTEHIEKHKLSFLRVFCEATSENGMGLYEFERKMKNILGDLEKHGNVLLCPYCNQGVKLGNYIEINVEILAGYLLAALCDEYDTPISQSIANNVKDYYHITLDTQDQEQYVKARERKITFKRVKEIFDHVFKCNERVKLSLNDEIIGTLDTFPSRVNLEYMVGQSILFNNTEYEIGHISKDRKTIYLRHENVTFKNCLDTIFLRRYKVLNQETIGEDGILDKTHGLIKEIKVSMKRADFYGETYGFYTLLSNCQTLDLANGAIGNLSLSQNTINEFSRNVKNGKILRVTLTTRSDCNDNMRLLLSSVFNEFIRTMFPKAYRQIAICPILEKPIEFDGNYKPSSFTDRVKTLYPYIMESSEAETDSKQMQFLFINDCIEDVGVLDWFYDRLGHYMHEFLANVYSYLNWLKLRPNLKHYIYFGDTKLPECFDINGCCNLLKDYNIILNESGIQEYETAGEIIDKLEPKTCSFCGKILESGRFVKFDDGRYVCAECEKTSVRSEEELIKSVESAKAYLSSHYPEIIFGAIEVKFFDGQFNKYDYVDTGLYYRLDVDKRTLYVQKSAPSASIERSVIRAMIQLWQHDNELLISSSDAQVVYEELQYLSYLNKGEIITKIKASLDSIILGGINDIETFINSNDGENATSFAYLRHCQEEISSSEDLYTQGEDVEDYELYDPNKISRFWKRYLRGSSVTEGEDELSVDERTEEDYDGVTEIVALDDVTEEDVEEDVIEEGVEEDVDDSTEESNGSGEDLI